ncbi:Grx4 family monothiol glutaredoxin [Candidatus Gracilibacteria bacterium]|nr:Grx4 family monothiol glutaredoxin [Candidatus Gracilibacteria bacterium]
MLTPELNQQIKDIIGSYRVVLFMKGSPEAPACGFSASAVAMLIDTDIYFESFDVYTNEIVRQGLKEFSSWPTFPQLYIDNELIGGIDILSEMQECGELEELKKTKNL